MRAMQPQPRAADGLPIDENGHLFGVTCWRCQCDLSGLPIEGACPQCAYNVLRSVPGDTPRTLGQVLDFRLPPIGALCSGCDSPIETLRYSSSCPTCGMRIALSGELARNAALTGRLVEDTPCINCGYNLRSLDRSARCPECGSVIIVSLFPKDLAVIHPAWGRSVAFACLGNAVLAMAAPIALCAKQLHTYSAVVESAVALMVIVSCFFACRPEPHIEGITGDRSRVHSGVAIWLLALVVLLAILCAIAWTLTGALPQVAVTAMVITGTCFLSCYYRHLSRIARRVAERELGSAFGFLNGLVLVSVLFVLATSVAPTHCFAVVAVIVLYLTTLVIHLRLSGALFKVAHDSSVILSNIAPGQPASKT